MKKILLVSLLGALLFTGCELVTPVVKEKKEQDPPFVGTWQNVWSYWDDQSDIRYYRQELSLDGDRWEATYSDDDGGEERSRGTWSTEGSAFTQVATGKYNSDLGAWEDVSKVTISGTWSLSNDKLLSLSYVDEEDSWVDNWLQKPEAAASAIPLEGLMGGYVFNFSGATAVWVEEDELWYFMVNGSKNQNNYSPYLTFALPSLTAGSSYITDGHAEDRGEEGTLFVQGLYSWDRGTYLDYGTLTIDSVDLTAGNIQGHFDNAMTSEDTTWFHGTFEVTIVN